MMTMTITVQTLRQLPFFAGLGDDALLEISPYIHERGFSPGQMVISEGQPCQAVYFVVRGVVRVHRLSLEGREHVLAYLGPGEFFNLVPVLDGGPNPATVDALTEVTLYTISCERFHQIVRDHHEVALPILEHMAARVRRLSDMVEGLALHTVRTRLARFLLAQAEDLQSSHHWTQEEIATNIGTVREMVGRTLRAFAVGGLIRRERGRIVVVNREGLEREAAGG
ncbi:MAG: Crp/Fnr family transcriptional regulator [Chloroflexi bacterium]|nr:Crp/Fnr family transcriptional regulator [Chloroflexota bacterium]